MFGTDSPDYEQGARWLTEIQGGLGRVTNPKAAEALDGARAEIIALLGVIGTAKDARQPFYHPTLPGGT